MANLIGVSAIVEKEGKILLVKEKSGEVNLPGGKVEFGEKIVDALKREFREETEGEIEPKYIVGIYHVPKSRTGDSVVIFVFASKVLKEPKKGIWIDKEKIEEQNFRWLFAKRAIEEYLKGRRLETEIVKELEA